MAAAGLQRDRQLAAMAELMRLEQAPAPEELRRNPEFDPARAVLKTCRLEGRITGNGRTAVEPYDPKIGPPAPFSGELAKNSATWWDRAVRR